MTVSCAMWVGRAVVSVLLLSQPIISGSDHGRSGVDGPEIDIPQRSYDLGTIIQGEIGTVKITVGNKGTASLIIKDTATSCGCTVVDLPEADRTIPPGESRDVTIRYDSTGHYGRHPNVVMFLTNDPVHPETRLIVTARIESLFRVLPDPLVNVQGARRGVALPALEIFPTRPGTHLQDLTVKMPPGLLEYEREEITDTNGVNGVRIVPRVPAEIELGDLQGEFVLNGVVDGQPAEVTVAVTGTVVGELRAVPPSLQSMGVTPRGHSFAPVTVESTTGRPFQVISSDAGPYIDAKATRVKDGQWKIQATLRDDAPDGPLAATLRLRTDSTGQPLFEIPIFVRVRPRLLVEPAVVLLGPLEENRGRTVRIQGETSAPLVIREVQGADERIDAKVQPSSGGPANVKLVRISLKAGDPPADDFVTQVTLVTTAAGAAPLQIPVEYAAPRK